MWNAFLASIAARLEHKLSPRATALVMLGAGFIALLLMFALAALLVVGGAPR